MPAGTWKTFAEGGYAKIYHNEETNEIRKDMEIIYEDEKYMNYSALIEASFLQSYRDVIHGIPRIRKIEVTDDNIISIYMPHYGLPLNKIKIPKNRVINVATKLLEILISLEKNGVQHTDLKPCNVLIQPDTYEVTVIDFNNLAFSVCNNNKLVHNRAYGTWSYCAPEILHYTKPTETSIVWTFGILLAYMYNKFPLIDMSSVRNVNDLSSRSFWIRIMNDLKDTQSDGPLLPPKHVATMPTHMIMLFQSCVQWDWKARIRLDDAYRGLTGVSYSGYVIKHAYTSHISSYAIYVIYEVCQKTKTMHAFSRIASIYSKACDCGAYDKSLLFTSHCLGLMLLGCYVVDNVVLSEQLRKLYNVSDESSDISTLKTSILKLCTGTQWDILGKTHDIILLETGGTNDIVEKTKDYLVHI